MAPNIPCLEIVLVWGTVLVFRDFSGWGGCSGVWGPFLSLRTVTVLGGRSGAWGLFYCDSLTVIITGLTLKGLKVLFITHNDVIGLRQFWLGLRKHFWEAFREGFHDRKATSSYGS